MNEARSVAERDDSRLIANVCVVLVFVSLYVELLDTSAEQLPFLGLLTDDGSCSGRGASVLA